MSIKEISRVLATQNCGEKLLVEICNALNVGKLPSDEAIQKLNASVDAMLGEEDPQMRLFQLLRKLDLNNPDGRPPISKSTKKLEQGNRMAKAYWWNWLMGCKKGEAAEKAANHFQLSGEFKEGYPSETTVLDNVKRYPQQSEFTFYHWRMLTEPNANEIKRAVGEIKRHLNRIG